MYPPLTVSSPKISIHNSSNNTVTSIPPELVSVYEQFIRSADCQETNEFCDMRLELCKLSDGGNFEATLLLARINAKIFRHNQQKGSYDYSCHYFHLAKNDQSLVDTVDKEMALLTDQFQHMSGNREATYRLGQRYVQGDGLSVDLAKAAELFHTSSSKGYGPASKMLAMMYRDGDGVKKSLKKANLYCTGAESQGCNSAEDKALFAQIKSQYNELLRVQQRSQEGDGNATYALAENHRLGKNGVALDLKLALHLFQLASSQGSAQATIKVIHMYWSGDVKVDKPIEQATNYLYIGIDQGIDLSHVLNDALKDISDNMKLATEDQNPVVAGLASYRLALHCLNGDMPGVEKDIDQAEKLLKKAEEAGHEGAAKMLKQGVIVDYRRIEEGSSMFTARSLCDVAGCYLDGVGGFPKNVNQAITYLQLAVSKYQSADAAFALGKHYVNNQQDQLAIENFEKAHQLGHSQAQLERLEFGLAIDEKDADYALGEYHYSGAGGVANKSLAAQHFEKAAVTGNVKSMERLAVMYQQGDGVETSDKKVIYYFDLAVQSSYSTALKWLDFDLAIQNGSHDAAFKGLESVIDVYSPNLKDNIDFYQLAINYYEGKNNRPKAPLEFVAKLLQIAALCEHPGALEKLGDIYKENANALSDNREYDACVARLDQAMAYFKQAMAGGAVQPNANSSSSANSSNNARWKLIEVKYDQAYISKLEVLSKHKQDKNATYEYAQAYFYGVRIAKNFNEAINMFEKAGQQGHKEGYYQAYQAHILSGQFTEVRPPFLAMAAKDGHADANHELGMGHSFGLAMRKSRTNAIRFFEEALRLYRLQPETPEINAKKAKTALQLGKTYIDKSLTRFSEEHQKGIAMLDLSVNLGNKEAETERKKYSTATFQLPKFTNTSKPSEFEKKQDEDFL